MWLAPPEAVGNSIKQRKAKGDDFKFTQWQIRAPPSYALDDKPGCMDQDDALGYKVTLAAVLDLSTGDARYVYRFVLDVGFQTGVVKDLDRDAVFA